ncbi:hypothetical protein CVT25_003748 [Psilocybe cyanescens]|uniref:Uncharacterized protein n=1 Tax=Psilocybe cyanescens TaxID=93625 RepID=A0A409XW77_PSICY|nr:hypothetical protein CVT25_003748 [Psilocybe cyanescens]
MNAADYALPSGNLLQTSSTVHTSNPSSELDLYAAWSDILSSSTDLPNQIVGSSDDWEGIPVKMDQ